MEGVENIGGEASFVGAAVPLMYPNWDLVLSGL